jgi:heterotetrameric sarcosine oxidase gamma subunit
LASGALSARSAFAGLAAALPGGGLVAVDRDGLGIASLSVRRGRRSVLQQRVAGALKIDLPDVPRRAVAGDTAAAGTGPGTWLVTREHAANALSEELRAVVGDSASVTDQSDAYAVIRLSGPGLRDILAKLVPIDLHPRAFAVGDVAATVLAHMGALLWRLEDDANGAAVIELAVFRSFAASLWHELVHHSL